MAKDTFTVANNSTSKAPTLPTLFQRKRSSASEHQTKENYSKRRANHKHLNQSATGKNVAW
ncbi:hypothetical protein [Vibrio sp. SCSIO 43136]|uniref:hypothetical protein n=1 Tax=Vibrio sp. SCSIO 43136 TaxID=2819101 RepID=UPI0020750230|nr:hypothetical protein [Vibrio sp. SCSIO 43136]USD64105.1 hypothetical protein J4N39_08225 [Vibrio sp. SCSIO 43136]